MAGEAVKDLKCSLCLYWRMSRPNEGWCLRLAPDVASSADRIAHWPLTHGEQYCGEFESSAAALKLPHCVDCRFWRRPQNGFEPVDRGDKLFSWWENAGHCCRNAPRPSTDPGPRAYWPATNAADQCGSGMLKPGAPPAR